MAEYVERDALLKMALQEKRFVFRIEDMLNSTEEFVVQTVYKDLFEAVNNIPKADVVEVKHGKWEKYLDGVELMCSCCKTTFWDEHGNGGTNYCPDCGAKMDGDDNA